MREIGYDLSDGLMRYVTRCTLDDHVSLKCVCQYLSDTTCVIVVRMSLLFFIRSQLFIRFSFVAPASSLNNPRCNVVVCGKSHPPSEVSEAIFVLSLLCLSCWMGYCNLYP